jgi:hypothetical protein
MFNIFYNQDPWIKNRVLFTKQLKHSILLTILNNLAFKFNKPISDKYIFSGPQKLTNNLIKIFKEDQIKYNKEHYKNSYILSYGVFGKKVLKNLKKDDFRSKKVLIGPLIPKENLYELFKEVNKYKNIKIVCASELIKDAFIELSDNKLEDKNFSVIPSPIKIVEKQKDIKLNNHKALIYFKKRKNEELIEVQNLLDKKNIQYKTFIYGDYNNQDLINEALTSTFGIILNKSESQGIAIQELMATNLPLFVIDYEKNEYLNLNSFKFSSVPYWSDKCGIKINNINDFENKIDEFIKNLTIYTPKDFIKENLSADKVRDRFIEEFR